MTFGRVVERRNSSPIDRNNNSKISDSLYLESGEESGIQSVWILYTCIAAMSEGSLQHRNRCLLRDRRPHVRLELQSMCTHHCDTMLPSEGRRCIS